MKSVFVIRKILLCNKRLLRPTIFVRNLSNDYIIKSEHNCEIPDVTIQEYMDERFTKYSKFTAIECGVTGRKYTYEQLRIKSSNLSKNLRKNLNLKEKDVVGILLPNIPEYPIAGLGILKAGLIITSINPIYTPDEISKQLTDSGAKVVITSVENFSKVKAALLKMKKTVPILVLKTSIDEVIPENSINFEEFVNKEVDIPDFAYGKSSDIAFLPYSSGTTGLPKGVLLTHKNLISNVTQVGHKDIDFAKYASETHQDVIPGVLPFFHIYGFTITLLSMFDHGSKIVTMPKFTPEYFINILDKHRPNIVFSAPPLVLFLTLHPDVKVEYLKSVEYVLCGAAPLGALDEERFIEKAGSHATVLQGYGLSETSPTVSTTTKALKEKFNCYGSIGRPVANTEMKLIAVGDSTGTPLGPNQQGELLIKGPQVMQGYLNKPEQTKEVFLDGWFRTGDLMEYNEDRLFFVKDRLKELIKVKGFQVAPAELEEIIRDFPSVNDAAVIGIPHPISGEVPRAYVVPKKDCKINAQDLEKFVAEKVAPFKQLKGGVAVVDTIPKTPTGKILRRDLKLQYEQENA